MAEKEKPYLVDKSRVTLELKLATATLKALGKYVEVVPPEPEKRKRKRKGAKDGG